MTSYSLKESEADLETDNIADNNAPASDRIIIIKYIHEYNKLKNNNQI